MSEAVKAAVFGALVTGLVNAGLLVWFLGGLKEKVSNHARLLSMLPCLKPKCPTTIQEG